VLVGVSVANTPWGVLAILLPLAGVLVCFLWPRRAKPLGLVTALGIVVCVAGLGWQVVEQGAQRYAVGGWGAPLGIDLYADGLSLLMLMVTAVVGLGISVYSSSYFEHKTAAVFWPLWLFLWAALNALFLSADIFNLYVTLELLGLAAVTCWVLPCSTTVLAASTLRYWQSGWSRHPRCGQPWG
jgi:formate hydrogenlyase subunit 3/multisubunit Na+/H+ antiporter MnhD subunit